MDLHLLAAVIVFALIGIFTLVLTGRDTPNAIALPVRHRALTPALALALAAVMRAVGVFLGAGLVNVVAAELDDVVPQQPASLFAIGAGVLTALGWGLYTWKRAVPVSSSHALTAGITGGVAALILTDTIEPRWDEVTQSLVFIIAAVFLSPAVATAVAWVLMVPALAIFRNHSTRSVKPPARMALAVSGAANALGHGVQYGQRIFLLLLLTAASTPGMGAPGWPAVVGIAVVMMVGTYLGSWQIGYTLTDRLVGLDSLRASIASMTSALLLILGSFIFHLPLSSTLTTGGAIVGAGSNQAHNAVRWPQVIRLTRYFILTIGISAVVGFILTAALSPLTSV